jgi:hypothetical protein
LFLISVWDLITMPYTVHNSTHILVIQPPRVISKKSQTFFTALLFWALTRTVLNVLFMEI